MYQQEKWDKHVIEIIRNGDIFIEGSCIYGKVLSTGGRHLLGFKHKGGIDINLQVNKKTVRYPYCRALWLHYYGEIENGYIIKHKDEDIYNNLIENLECVPYCGKHFNPQRWSDADSEFLRDNYLNLSLSELANKVNRSIKAVRHKLKALNAPEKRSKWKAWTAEEDSMLEKLYKEKFSIKEICVLIGRSEHSVRLRATRRLNAFRSERHLQKTFKTNNFYISLKAKITHTTAGAKCCICGYEKHIDLHHIDGDRNNHAMKNIASLCPNCHREVEHNEHTDKELYCIWWRVYPDGSKSEVFDNRADIAHGI